MVHHHIQKSILYKLAFSDGENFSSLKPDLVENKLFTYHLKKLIQAKLVAKNQARVYVLTSEGRRLGIRMIDTSFRVSETAESVLFLVVRNQKESSWLLYRRSAHPLKSLSGFMHAIPVASESIEQTATRTLRENTGLETTFNVLGSGFFRIYTNNELESFTNFTLLYSDHVEGFLDDSDPLAEYSWQSNPDFSSEEMLPNMQLLADLYLKKKEFFIDETINLES
jgi:hypothetical protein